MMFPEWWFYTTAGAALAGLGIAIYRSWVARKEERTARQGLLDDRFKMGVDLLGRDKLAVRVGGVYVLADMAKLYPEHNHVRVMEIFASFLAHPPRYTSGPEKGSVDLKSADTVAIIEAINARTLPQRQIEKRQDYDLGKRIRGGIFIVREGRVVENTLQVAMDKTLPPDIP